MGYHEIPGVDFTYVYAPVIHNVTLRTVLVLKMVNGWKMVKADIEAAFLEGYLHEKVFIELPEGLERIKKLKGDEIGELDRAM